VVNNAIENVPIDLLEGGEKVQIEMSVVPLQDEPRVYDPDAAMCMHELAAFERDALSAAAKWRVQTQSLITYFKRLEPGLIGMVLDLSGTGLRDVPLPVLGLTHLTSLSLNDNRLTQLPLGLAELSLLNTLDLSGNKGIEWLDAKHLGGSVLLTMLERLRLGMKGDVAFADLHLRMLPTCLWEIDGISCLDVSRNELIALPPDIGALTALRSLTILDVSHNMLRSLPPSIGSLPLVHLTCSHNHLKNAPPELAQCASTLCSLKLDHNTVLESPPPPVVAAGFAEVMSYLKELLHSRSTDIMDLSGEKFLRIPLELTEYSHIKVLPYPLV
jgi:hypothetical protein